MTRRVRVYVRGAVVLCALNEILLSRLIAPPRPRRCGPLLARTRSRARSQAPLFVVAELPNVGPLRMT